MKVSTLVLIAVCSLFMFSCVSKKKFREEQVRYETLNTTHTQLQSSLKNCEDEKAEANKQKAAMQTDIENLNRHVALLKENNTQALKQLQDMSVISAAQAASINKSLENIGAKDAYIQDLQTAMARKDSLNMTLVMNLKGAIGNLEDEDINIKVDRGVVYIDISDKLLFKSGSYEVAPQAKVVLEKVAAVLKNQPDMEYMVEGHTDNVPYTRGVLQDNW